MLRHLYRVTQAIVREHVYKLVARNGEWPIVRKHYLEKQGSCEACGSIEHLQVHHVVPFHDDPTKELDLTNLITLCMSLNECHLLIGHSGSFKTFNPNVRTDAIEALEHPERFDSIRAKALIAALPNIPGE